jgi:hypothetical protein
VGAHLGPSHGPEEGYRGPLSPRGYSLSGALGAFCVSVSQHPLAFLGGNYIPTPHPLKLGSNFEVPGLTGISVWVQVDAAAIGVDPGVVAHHRDLLVEGVEPVLRFVRQRNDLVRPLAERVVGAFRRMVSDWAGKLCLVWRQSVVFAWEFIFFTRRSKSFL